MFTYDNVVTAGEKVNSVITYYCGICSKKRDETQETSSGLAKFRYKWDKDFCNKNEIFKIELFDKYYNNLTNFLFPLKTFTLEPSGKELYLFENDKFHETKHVFISSKYLFDYILNEKIVKLMICSKEKKSIRKIAGTVMYII